MKKRDLKIAVIKTYKDGKHDVETIKEFNVIDDLKGRCLLSAYEPMHNLFLSECDLFRLSLELGLSEKCDEIAVGLLEATTDDDEFREIALEVKTYFMQDGKVCER